jgi:hypothetical protein
LDWKPQAKQEKFLRLPWYECLFGGTKGPGKTDALLAEATRQLEIPGYQGIIFRRTQPKLTEIVERSFKWFNKTGPSWNGEKLRWTWPNRNFIAFGYCKDEKDKYNYQGHEYGFMGFDQLEEFTETMYLFLLAQNRSSAPGIKCYTRSTANPGNIGHAWVKARFIDKLAKDGTPKYFRRIGDEDKESNVDDHLALSRAFVFASVEDNEILLKNDPDYLKRLDMLPEVDKKALRYGDWDIFAGQFFKEWAKRIHVIPSAVDFGIPNNRFIAFDYGYGAPASVGWYAVFPTGQIIRYKEFYHEGYTYEDLAYKILEINGSDPVAYAVADPAIWGDMPHHLQNAYKTKPLEAKGESGGETMHRIFSDENRPGPVHFPLMRADNARIIGWGRVREYLKPYFTPEGKETAQFLVTENCLNFIRTIPGLIHDSIITEDLDTSGEDHAADECRYALMSRPRIPILPPPPKTPAKEFWERVEADKKAFANANEPEGIRSLSTGESTRSI